MPKMKVELKKVVDNSYDIEIGRNLIDILVEDIVSGKLFSPSRIIIITDSTVKDLYGDRISQMLTERAVKNDLLYFTAGEQSKTRKTKEQLEDRMLELGCKRDCAVLAVGGGVVSDIAGFTAATFGRGVPYIVYSTTLLSAADASVGGKTAVDTPLATNLIGAFYQPKKVYIDTKSWETLPIRQISCGLSETIKHACIADTDFFNYLEENIERLIALDETVCAHVAMKNCEIKSNVVAKDEHESGLREVLNLGHTVGRAIETESNYKLLHGEAVSIGLVAQAKLSVMLGLLDVKSEKRLEALLKRSALPTKIPKDISVENLLKRLYTDKKVRDGKLRFVIMDRIGSIAVFSKDNWAKEIEEETIGKILSEMSE